MAGVRYRAEFKSIDNIEWKIDIYDADYSGSVNTFPVYGEGFELSYRGDNAEIYSPIMPSELTIFCLAEDASFDTLVADMIGADEERFSVHLYKDSNLYWAGMVLQDIFTYEDKYYPQKHTIKATDGLKTLETLDYNDGGTAYSGEDTVLDHLLNCLNKLPYVDHVWGASDGFLTTCMRWFDQNMVYSAGTNPENKIKIDHATYITKIDGSTNEYVNTYEVLKDITQTFFCKLALTDGVFKWIQIQEFEAANYSTVYEATWQKGGSASGSPVTVDYSKTIDGSSIVKLATMVNEFRPALKEVTRIFNHKTSGNLLQGQTITAAVNVGSIDSDSGAARFAFKGALEISVSATATVTARALVRATFKVGSNYLTRDNAIGSSMNQDYTDITWESSTDYIDFWTDFMVVLVPSGTVTKVVSIATEFETLNIPADGDLEVNLEIVGIYNQSGTNIDGVSATATAQWINPYLEYIGSSAASETERLFKVSNDTTASFSDVVEIPTTLIGDQVNPQTVGGLTVYDGASYVASTGWRRENSGTYYNINQLLINEVVGKQRNAIRVLTGRIRGDFDILDVLVNGSNNLVSISGTLSANSNQWQVERYNIQTDTSSLTIATPTGIPNDTIPSQSNDFKTILPGTTPLQPNGGKIGVNTVPTDATFDVKQSDDSESILIKVQTSGGDGVFSVDEDGKVQIGLLSKENVVLGSTNTGGAITTGLGNVFLGYDTGYSTTTGDANVFLGNDAGYSNTTGDTNTFIGNRSGYSNTTASNNTFVGYSAGFNTTGDTNTFIGNRSGYSNTTGGSNTMIGYLAGYSNTTASRNTMIGRETGYSNTTGGSNTMIGYRAGYTNNTGQQNVFIGDVSANANTTGSEGVVIGFEAGYNNTTGGGNVFIGRRAGYSNTTGVRSVYVGLQAGNSSTGNYNVAVGFRAGYNNTSGANNVFLGNQAGPSSTSTASNELYIHNASGTPTIYADFSQAWVGINTASPSASFHINHTDGIIIPVGTTAQRTAFKGLIRLNSTTGKFEGYDGTTWHNFH